MRKIWTAQEVELLKEMYPHHPTDVIAQQLGVSTHSVYHKAHQLKLSKSSVYLAEKRQKEAELLRVIGAKHQFNKGNVPLNKGKKQSEFMTSEAIEKTIPTRFKKGQMPHNKALIGHTRTTKDGYILVKVAEPNTFKLLHRFVWKVWNGEIPAGCNIAFKDGNRQNCNIENLYLKTKQQNMAENTIQRYPAELQEILKINKKLTRKIESYGKK